MKIAILGTRGIPNHYGGFEQFAEYFSVYLAERGHNVYVYNSHNHPYQEATYRGVNILHQHDSEHKIGTAGQFIYDLNCILDSRKRNFDIILQLGYTSNSVWYFLLPKKSIIITNMDGMEWKRTKYSFLTQKVLKVAERFAVKSSRVLVADSVGIQRYLKNEYNREAVFIAYGANIFDSPDPSVLTKWSVEVEKYNMIMARFEPENNIDIVLEGVSMCNSDSPILVIGNHNTKYGNFLRTKYQKFPHIRFVGAIYDMESLNNLRYYSNLYFHGHSVGGTNPSLLEAMASGALVIAHNNEFNKAILGSDGLYFSTSEDVKKILQTIKKNNNLQLVRNNIEAVKTGYNWNKINGEYLQLFENSISGFSK